MEAQAEDAWHRLGERFMREWRSGYGDQGSRGHCESLASHDGSEAESGEKRASRRASSVHTAARYGARS